MIPIQIGSHQIDERIAQKSSDSDIILSYSTHTPITITNNADFELQAWPGQGTVANPYLISNLNITSQTAVCISVVNTTSYFTITDCWFRAYDSDWAQGMINFENVIHGRVQDNTFDSGHIAIFVERSSSCNFLRNSIGTSLMGFLAYNLNNSVFSSNVQTSESMGYPVHIEHGNNVVIRSNFFQDSTYEGIGLTDCTDCTLEFNTLSGGDLHLGQYGFAIRNSENCYIQENDITNCGTAIEITDAKSHSISGNIISGCWGGVMIRGNDSTVANNNISVNGFCVQLRGSFRTVVHSNYLRSSIIALGIDVSGGGFSNITENTFYRHEYGIRLQGVRNLTVANNNFSECYQAIILDEIAYIGLNSGPPIQCKIINNELGDSGIGFAISDPDGMNHEIRGNMVNGRELAYFFRVSNLEIEGSNYGRIILVDCDRIAINGGTLDELMIAFSSNCEIMGITVINQTNGIHIRNSLNTIIGFSRVINCEVGVRLEWSNFSYIFRTTVLDNGHGFLIENSPNTTIYDCQSNHNEYGIVLIGAHESHIESNMVYGNGHGIYILRTNEAYIGNNDILENSGTGLLLNRGSRFNRIIANRFGWNSINAICSGFDNLWDDGEKVGNKWSDLGANHVYFIDEDDIDRFPSLLENGTSTNLPTNGSVSNRTWIPGQVTPEIAAITVSSLLGIFAVVIIFARRHESP